MKQKTLYLLLFLIVTPFEVLSSNAASNRAQTRPPATESEVTAAESFCRDAAHFAAKQRIPRFFGDMASMEIGTTENWREFKSAKEREQAATDENLFQTADVTLRDSKALLVSFMFTSPSGDWAHYVDACYRPDGTLARAIAELRTFNGNIRVVRTIHFSPSARELKRKTEYFDLDTGKKMKKPAPDMFLDQDPPLFLRAKDLPFFRLL